MGSEDSWLGHQSRGNKRKTTAKPDFIKIKNLHASKPTTEKMKKQPTEEKICESFFLRRDLIQNIERTLLFLSIIYWLCYYSFPNFPPWFPLRPAFPNPPAFPALSSCPWVVHVSSLSSLFPIPFLSLPIYVMPTNYASSSLYLPPLFLFSPSPLKSLRVMFISLILLMFWLA